MIRSAAILLLETAILLFERRDSIQQELRNACEKNSGASVGARRRVLRATGVHGGATPGPGS